MSIKTKIKSRLSWLRALRHYILYIKLHYLYPIQQKRYGCKSSTARVETPVFFTNQANVFLEDNTVLRSGFSLINTTGKFILKKNSMISINCTAVTGNHSKVVSIPLKLSTANHIGDIERDIIIDEEAWIGVNVTLLSGAKIGRGAIIGACSMVNKEIPPYAVAVGSPAKVIASTFTINQIIEHERNLYSPEERFSREYLEQLFATHFSGKRSVGIDSTPEMREIVANQISNIGLKLYK